MLQEKTSMASLPPDLLVIGYDPDFVMKSTYGRRVLFKHADEVMIPEDIPPGIRSLIVNQRKIVAEGHDRRLINLARAAKASYEVTGGGLPRLKEILEERYPLPPSNPEVARCKPATVEVESEPTPTSTPDTDSPELKAIRAISCRAGSIKEFLRDHVTWPCHPPEQARLLWPAVRVQFPNTSTTSNSLATQISMILKQANVSATSNDSSPLLKQPTNPSGEKIIEALKTRIANLEQTTALLQAQMSVLKAQGKQDQTLLEEFRQLALRIKPNSK